MPSINDLKKNNTGNKTQVNIPVKDDVVVDLTSAEGLKESMEHNEAIYNNRPKGKTVINQPSTIKGPDGKIYNNPNVRKSNNSDNRVAFDLTKLPEDKKDDEDIHTSIQDDILSGKNPILYDYIKEKSEEMQQWMEEKEAQRELQQVEAENEGVEIDLTAPPTDLKADDSLSFDKFESGQNATEQNESYTIIDDLDLGDSDNMNEEISTNDDLNVTDHIEVEEETTENEEVISGSVDVDEIETTVAEDSIDNEDEIDNNNIEEPVLEEITTNIGEVDSTPEVDTSVSAEGIEFQEPDAINREAISIEDEDDNINNEEKSLVDELDPGARHIIELATKVLKPAAKKMDLSSFTVVKKPGSNNRFFEQKQINVAKWVLRTKKVCIHMKASQGAELEELRTLMQEAESATDFIRMYRIIYDHIVSPKPTSFEAWCKSTYTDDIDDYFFGFFIANYKNSNYLPYDCTNKDCQPGTFLSDNIPIMNMVKFASDKDKEEFNRIYKSEIFDTNTEGLYATERIAFSDQLAIGFKESAVYSYIEAQSIRNNEAFINRYNTTIGLIPYIDDIFSIDMENHSLYPVQYKVYPDSNANTYKSKVQKYDSVLKSLSADEFATLATYVSNFSNDKKNSIGIKYIRPAATCPDCGAKIEEQETTAQSLVFFRYQLGQMVNISTK